MEIVVQRRRSGYGKKTKTVQGVKRDRFGQDAPPLLPEVHEAMKELAEDYNAKQEASGLIFPNHEGGYHYRTMLQKPFEDICKHAGITKRFTPHGCRRTGAKLYGKTAGTRMAMEIAGHLTVEMHEHYAGVDADEKLAAARATFEKLRLIPGPEASSKGVEKRSEEERFEVETGTQTGTQAISKKLGGHGRSWI
jgi:integrase